MGATEPKIVMAESVRQALIYAKGDAEAALVGRRSPNVPEIRGVEVDPKLYDPIIQALGVVAAPHDLRTPSNSRGSSWTRRDRAS